MITLLYATVSGRAEQFATIARDRLETFGWPTELYNVAAFPAARLRSVHTTLIITSSWGEGTAPPDALEFLRDIESPRLTLRQLNFAVLALGAQTDRPYIGCGWRIDTALEERGAKRLFPRHECDRDSISGFQVWLKSLETVIRYNEALFLPGQKLA